MEGRAFSQYRPPEHQGSRWWPIERCPVSRHVLEFVSRLLAAHLYRVRIMTAALACGLSWIERSGMLVGRTPSTAVSDHGSALRMASRRGPQPRGCHRRAADIAARGRSAAPTGDPATADLARTRDPGRAGAGTPPRHPGSPTGHSSHRVGLVSALDLAKMDLPAPSAPSGSGADQRGDPGLDSPTGEGNSDLG